MKLRTATEVWLGRYRHDTASMPDAVAFRMLLREDDSHVLRGTVHDDAEAGSSEEGRIEGTVRDGELQFVKLMPVLRIGDGGRTTSLRDYLLKSWNVVIERNPPHLPIRYAGTFDDEWETASGTWIIDAAIVPLETDRGRLELPFPSATGRWEMSRVRE
jgi:hypothetical protein